MGMNNNKTTGRYKHFCHMFISINVDDNDMFLLVTYNMQLAAQDYKVTPSLIFSNLQFWHLFYGSRTFQFIYLFYGVFAIIGARYGSQMPWTPNN